MGIVVQLLTYFWGTIHEVRMESLTRLQIILLRESKVHQHRHTVFAQEDIGRPVGGVVSTKQCSINGVFSILDVVMHDSPFVQKFDA